MSGAARTLRIAVVGATSLIGEAVIQELRARAFPFAELYALDDERHVGRAVREEEGEAADLKTGAVDAFDFAAVDLAFFCGRAALSERYAAAAAAHAWVIDNSAAFRARLSSCSHFLAKPGVDDNVKIVVRVSFKRDGTLASPPAMVDTNFFPRGTALMDAAVEALRKCQPFTELPADKYREWKTLDLVITPFPLSGE